MRPDGTVEPAPAASAPEAETAGDSALVDLLAARWQDTLGLPAPDPDANFFRAPTPAKLAATLSRPTRRR